MSGYKFASWPDSSHGPVVASGHRRRAVSGGGRSRRTVDPDRAGEIRSVMVHLVNYQPFDPDRRDPGPGKVFTINLAINGRI
jgi:hypothetical protein